MGNNSVPKFIFHLSRFPVYRGSVLGRFCCIKINRQTRIFENENSLKFFLLNVRTHKFKKGLMVKLALHRPGQTLRAPVG